jgi:crotonobetainyl-CoA:carnitine CoA-transferase CaiB-like acyl-CoA transferase
LAATDRSTHDGEGPEPERAAEARPLQGLRIAEVANVVAGPSVGKHLSDFGAEVIKVERPGVGDATRSMGESVGDRSAWWVMIGRNKRSVTLDLKNPEGRAAFLRLIETCDALVESQRPGVMEALDLGPEQLREVNPDLIVVRISGFGQTGPYRLRPGFGTLAEAFSGLASMTGYPDRPPLLAPTAIADEVAGLFATWSLMVALYHRDVHGGPGQTIDVSLFESLFALLGPLPTLYQQHGYVQPRAGSRLPWSAPRNVYRSKDDRFFVVSGTAPAPAEKIMHMVGGDALLSDPRFATPQSRGEHADELDALVADWIAARTAAEVDQEFTTHKIAGIRVLEMPEIFEDEHFRARGTLVEIADETLGAVALQGPVPRMSHTPGQIDHIGGALGSETDDVLQELGYTEDEVRRGRLDGAW